MERRAGREETGVEGEGIIPHQLLPLSRVSPCALHADMQFFPSCREYWYQSLAVAREPW